MTKGIELTLPELGICFKQQWNLIRTGFLLLTWIMLVCVTCKNIRMFYSVEGDAHLDLTDIVMPSLVEYLKIGYKGMGSALFL